MYHSWLCDRGSSFVFSFNLFSYLITLRSSFRVLFCSMQQSHQWLLPRGIELVLELQTEEGEDRTCSCLPWSNLSFRGSVTNEHKHGSWSSWIRNSFPIESSPISSRTEGRTRGFKCSCSRFFIWKHWTLCSRCSFIHWVKQEPNSGGSWSLQNFVSGHRTFQNIFLRPTNYSFH